MPFEKDDGPSSKRRRIESLSVMPTSNITSTPLLIKDRELSNDELSDEIKKAKAIFRLAFAELTGNALSETLRTAMNNLINNKVSLDCIIAILGSSGSGKSTLFNALLGKFGILPQGCGGHACTAAPIELHYNPKSDPAFRVKVEYISVSDWLADIRIAQANWETLLGCSEHALGPITKVKAVYPDLSEDALKSMAPNDLLDQVHTKGFLGKTTIYHTNDFRECRDHVRSKVVASAPQSSTINAQPAWWPLIKVVKIYVKSALLSCGIVFADVPGSNDSNAARNARAKEYMRTCSAACIVTQASRGGSDAALSNMVRDALFDMHYGGHLDRVVLVSTMSDAISMDELEQDFEHEQQEEARTQQEKLQKKLSNAQNKLPELKQAMIEAKEWTDAHRIDLKHWNTARRALAMGKIVYPPKTRIGNGRKFMKTEDKEPLKDVEAVEDKIRLFTNQLASWQERFSILQKEVGRHERTIVQISDKIQQCEDRMRRIIIQSRNNGLKQSQLDMYVEEIQRHDADICEAARDVHDASSEPPAPTRDYEQLRKELPVFCTSARAYQCIKGFKRDPSAITVYQDIADTEIPALSQHLSQVGIAAKHEKLLRIYNDALLALSQLNVSISKEVETRQIDPQQAIVAVGRAKHMLKEVPDRIDACINSIATVIKKNYESSFTNKIASIQTASLKLVLKQMVLWEQTPQRTPDDRGLFWQEYRAACKRLGRWAGKRCQFDLNDWIRLEIQTGAQNRTDEVFAANDSASCIVINSSFKALDTDLDTMHNNFRAAAAEAGVSAAVLYEIDEQVKLRKVNLQATARDANRRISTVHLAASDKLTTDIQTAMRNAYNEAKDASGPGVLVTMSDTLRASIKANHASTLARPLRDWERRIAQAIDEENDVTKHALKRFEKSMVSAYEDALGKRQSQVESARDPVQEKVRGFIMRSKLLEGDMVDTVAKKAKEGTENFERHMNTLLKEYAEEHGKVESEKGWTREAVGVDGGKGEQDGEQSMREKGDDGNDETEDETGDETEDKIEHDGETDDPAADSGKHSEDCYCADCFVP